MALRIQNFREIHPLASEKIGIYVLRTPMRMSVLNSWVISIKCQYISQLNSYFQFENGKWLPRRQQIRIKKIFFRGNENGTKFWSLKVKVWGGK